MTKTEDIKVIVLPQGPYIETGTSIISLPHPNNVSMLFMLSTSQLLQLQKFSNTTNSWVIGERIVQNGDLYTATPFDLNFLLIPLLDGKKVSSLLKDMENLEALKLFKKETVDEQHKLAIRLLSDNLQKSHVDMLLKEFK
ncbi:hypothetical protein HDV02_002490 [Globomyces sp. JEL0801]|nr:hypothetical protein HDV02_002490 [Globomyces sp. JEL0801]